MDQNYQTQQTRPNNPPKNWLVESILVTIFCCLPFGIAGIVNSANVNSRFNSGDFDGAERAAREAAKWTKLGFFIGLALIVLYFVLVFLFGVTIVRFGQDAAWGER
jgi:hypothetical protein